MAKKKYRKNPEISERAVDNAVFLVNSDNDTVYHLNDLGAALWRLLETPMSIPQMTSVVELAFSDIPRKQIRTDMEKLIKRLEKKRLVIRVD